MLAYKNILVTGGAGFIGANLVEYLLEHYAHIHVINLDKLTYAGKLSNLQAVCDNPRYTFIKGDIADAVLVAKIFEKYAIDAVFHLAAESHVDTSITNPGAFIQTNITGTFTLLQAAKHAWLCAANTIKPAFKNACFLHVSTDEVYGALPSTGFFTEQTPYAPNSPYSASKASSDFLVRSYFHTYGLPVVTTNCSNNYGPKQHTEKLIPTIIHHAIAKKPIPIYGTGTNVRDWLYVIDHCKGLIRAITQGKKGETYIIGGTNEHTNIAIAHKICAILDRVYPKEQGSYKDQITFVEDRLGHDFRYAIDATKIKTELDWQPQYSFADALEQTVFWYLNRYNK